jgi:integrase
MIVLLDKELWDGSLSRKICKLAEKILKEPAHPHMLRHSSVTRWADRFRGREREI